MLSLAFLALLEVAWV